MLVWEKSQTFVFRFISRILNHGTGTGNQPLSWCARTQIALDAAKGLEYIHDYTKARYVHRDVKTSNILLDEKLRAKVHFP